MFSKRHYEVIAARMRNASVLIEECGQAIAKDAWACCCEELAAGFRSEPRFDRVRFLTACCETVADRNRLLYDIGDR